MKVPSTIDGIETVAIGRDVSFYDKVAGRWVAVWSPTNDLLKYVPVNGSDHVTVTKVDPLKLLCNTGEINPRYLKMIRNLANMERIADARRKAFESQ